MFSLLFFYFRTLEVKRRKTDLSIDSEMHLIKFERNIIIASFQYCHGVPKQYNEKKRQSKKEIKMSIMTVYIERPQDLKVIFFKESLTRRLDIRSIYKN